LRKPVRQKSEFGRPVFALRYRSPVCTFEVLQDIGWLADFKCAKLAAKILPLQLDCIHPRVGRPLTAPGHEFVDLIRGSFSEDFD
jgi:hypothetical protein